MSGSSTIGHDVTDSPGGDDQSAERDEAERYWQRGRIAVWSAFGGVLLVAASLIGFGYYATHNKPDYQVPARSAIHSDGIVAGGNGPKRIDMYVDYQCTDCQPFVTSIGSTLAQLVATNRITLVIHPLALPDAGGTPSRSAIRAAGATGCASDLGNVLTFTNLMLGGAQTPTATDATSTSTSTSTKPTSSKSSGSNSSGSKSSGSKSSGSKSGSSKSSGGKSSGGKSSGGKATGTTSGGDTSGGKSGEPPTSTAPAGTATKPVLTDDQIVHVGGSAGIIDPRFAQCVRSGSYDKWASSENAMAAKANITMAPTILVDGASIAAGGQMPTVDELKAAVG